MVDQSVSSRPVYAPNRPLSPHLQIWRWAVTMATSILHRATGSALYVGAVLFTLLLVAAAISDGFYAAVAGLLGSPLGYLALVLFSWAGMFHLANGIKYLIWDTGMLLQRGQAKTTAWVVIAVSFVLTALVWIAVLATKGA